MEMLLFRLELRSDYSGRKFMFRLKLYLRVLYTLETFIGFAENGTY
jgi:hypothetical protein